MGSTDTGLRPDSPLIDIAIEDATWQTLGDLDALAARAIAAAIATSGIPVPVGAELSLVLCDDAFIRTLNRDWRGKDAATNVLSFPTDETAQAYALGDIVVAWETSAGEAEAAGTPMADYLAHLIVHGFLHLLGFDHENDDEAEAMEALETRTLAALGLASPYLASPAAEAHAPS